MQNHTNDFMQWLEAGTNEILAVTQMPEQNHQMHAAQILKYLELKQTRVQEIIERETGLKIAVEFTIFDGTRNNKDAAIMSLFDAAVQLGWERKESKGHIWYKYENGIGNAVVVHGTRAHETK